MGENETKNIGTTRYFINLNQFTKIVYSGVLVKKKENHPKNASHNYYF